MSFSRVGHGVSLLWRAIACGTTGDGTNKDSGGIFKEKPEFFFKVPGEPFFRRVRLYRQDGQKFRWRPGLLSIRHATAIDIPPIVYISENLYHEPVWGSRPSLQTNFESPKFRDTSIRAQRTQGKGFRGTCVIIYDCQKA